MPSPDHALVSLLSQLVLSFDGAVLGLTLAYAAVRSVLRVSAASSALHKLQKAPFVSVSGLRSLLAVDNPDQLDSPAQTLVVVRGTVEVRSSVEGKWKSFKPNVLVSQESGDKAVVIQRTQTCIYNEWKGFFGWTWTSELRSIFAKSSREQESISTRTVPFVLVEAEQWPHTNYVIVNIDRSRHPLPLTTVYHQLQPINPSPYTFLQALFGHEYPVGLLYQEKILPLGKEICAVGLCSFRNGIPEIKPCNNLPYFMSEMTKDQMVGDLAFKVKILFWGGIVLGSLSVGVLGYAIVSNWYKWKAWRRQRQSRGANDNAVVDIEPQIMSDEEVGDIPDGELCVICLMRRRRSAFIPCGHRVCCRQCAISIERESSPKCPVCRQQIRTSVRIYDS